MEKILTEGEKRDDRTGVGTYSLFGEQLKFDLTEGFPAVTTKKLWFKGVKEELAWMLRGETNIKSLQEKGVEIWTPWADKDGDLGPVYGAQWRNWNGVDQIAELEIDLKKNPTSRRHILSAWNVGELKHMALAPCHVMCQFYVREGKFLDGHMYQRSCDYLLGGPFNFAQYALLTTILADRTHYTPGKLTVSYGDVHIYQNHVEQCREQLNRNPFPKPGLMRKSVHVHRIEDEPLLYNLSDYQHHPAIKAEIAV